jgi:hypothetical protein
MAGNGELVGAGFALRLSIIAGILGVGILAIVGNEGNDLVLPAK